MRRGRAAARSLICSKPSPRSLSMLSIRNACVAGVLATTSLAANAQADVINEWNEQWWDTIRAVGGAPCPLARSQAVLFTSIYEGVNSVDRQYDPFLKFLNFK